MAKPVTGQTTFGSNTTGTTTQLDNNFLLAYNALNDLNTFSNYLVDTGSANAYVVTLGAGLTGPLTAGLEIEMKATNLNTGASTLNFNGTGAVAIQRVNGASLTAGDIPAGGIVQLIWTGSVWMLLNVLPATVSVQAFAGSFSVNLATTGAQTVSGIGFLIKGLWLSSAGVSNSYIVTDGNCDSALHQGCLFGSSATRGGSATAALVFSDATANVLNAPVTTINVSGQFTITKAVGAGSPTGTAVVNYIAVG